MAGGIVNRSLGMASAGSSTIPTVCGLEAATRKHGGSDRA
jgi:hypothetical protein